MVRLSNRVIATVLNELNNRLSLLIENSFVVYFFPEMKLFQVQATAANKLTRLHDLSNISNTHVELYLEKNQILVDGIPPKSVLKILNLTGNDLIEYPDLRNAGSTTQEVSLFENKLTSFPEALLRPLLTLEILYVCHGESQKAINHTTI